RKSLRLFPRVFFRFLSGLSEPRQPLCKFIAAGWSQPALLHFEIILDRRWGQCGLRQPLAFLRTVKALADFFAEVLEHGATALSATRRLPCYPKVSPCVCAVHDSPALFFAAARRVWPSLTVDLKCEKRLGGWATAAIESTGSRRELVRVGRAA